ncbi:hypothetical protein DL96DRAFT_246595 [Flagelloscypha sp. PMI_526]|nr:hypothetical protein DL96DRAFT_246595 [Flagelloscypha sp. PMI_526]
MSGRSSSLKSGGSSGRVPRRPRSPPSLYVAPEQGATNSPKPLLPRKEKAQKPLKRSQTFNDPYLSGQPSAWPSSPSLASATSSNDGHSSSAGQRQHQSKGSVGSFFSGFSLRRKASKTVVHPDPVPEDPWQTNPISAPATTRSRDLNVAPWESPLETSFPSHPAASPRSSSFTLTGSPAPQQYHLPHRYTSPQPQYQAPASPLPSPSLSMKQPSAVPYIRNPIPTTRPPLPMHSVDSLHSGSHASGSVQSSEYRSDSLEMFRSPPVPIRLRTQSDSSDSVIDIKPIQVARKAPPPVTMEITPVSPSLSSLAHPPESPATTRRTLLSPLSQMQALRIEPLQPKFAPSDDEKRILNASRKGVKDGWSGEWNTTDMQDVISRLRSLR